MDCSIDDKEIDKFRFVDMLVMHTFFKTVVSMSMVDTEKKTGIKQGQNNLEAVK